MGTPFVYVTRVAFSQVDAAGILYFSRAFELCHEAFEGFLEEQGTPMTQATMAGADWVLPIVHAEVDFRSPLRLGDRVDVEVNVERMGTSSITMAFCLRGADGSIRAMVRHVHAAVEVATFSSRPLPDEVRAWGAVHEDEA